MVTVHKTSVPKVNKRKYLVKDGRCREAMAETDTERGRTGEKPEPEMKGENGRGRRQNEKRGVNTGLGLEMVPEKQFGRALSHGLT